MSRRLLLSSGAFALLAAAGFVWPQSAIAACTVSSGTLVAPNSGAVIVCTDSTNGGAGSVINNAAADNVSITVQHASSVSSGSVGAFSAPTTIRVGNNARLTVNADATLSSQGLFNDGIALQAGNALTATVLQGGQVLGQIRAGSGSHITLRGTMSSGAPAINLSGDNNTVVLQSGYVLNTGAQAVNGGTAGAVNTTLELNGASGAFLFDASGLGTKFTNFSRFVKSGISQLSLSGIPTIVTPWTVLDRGGSLSIVDDASLGPDAGTLTLNGGALLVVGTGTVTSRRSIVMGANGGVLATGPLTTYIAEGRITGIGSLQVTGSGAVELRGENSYAGATELRLGTLRLGPGGSLPSTSIVNFVNIDDAILDINGHNQVVGGLSDALRESRRSDRLVSLGGGKLTIQQQIDTEYNGRFDGGGTLAKTGSGTLTLSGANSAYAGSTTVEGGVLAITGAINRVAVARGGTLRGTGNAGAVSVAAGGKLAPGTAAGTGTLNATSLTLAADSTTAITLTPDGGSNTMQVSGGASLGGILSATALAGSYTQGLKYTVVTAQGGVSGQFSSVTVSGLPASLRPKLSYDARNAYVTLAANMVTPSLPAGTGQNQGAVAAAIDEALKARPTLPASFEALLDQTGPALSASLDQLVGQPAVNASLLFSQAVARVQSQITQAFAGIGGMAGLPAGARPAQLATFGTVTLRGAVYGGQTDFEAQSSGAAALDSTSFGGSLGLESELGDDLVVGLGVAGGSTGFSQANGLSTGRSTDIMVLGHARYSFADAYLSGTLSHAWHDVRSTRIITIAGTDILRGTFDGTDWGGRGEAGYHLGAGIIGASSLTLFGAIAGNQSATPAYSETATAGTNAFALSYAAQEAGLMHSELGLRLQQDFAVERGTLRLRFDGAWAHQIQSDNLTGATFQNLPGASFLVAGVTLPEDSAVLGGGLEFDANNGMRGAVRIDSRLGSGFSAVAGTISLGYAW